MKPHHARRSSAPQLHPSTTVTVLHLIFRLLLVFTIIYAIYVWHALESAKLLSSDRLIWRPGPGPRPDALSVSLRPRADLRTFRVFLVTFHAHTAASKVVEDLLKSDLTDFTFEIVVINNWGTFSFPPDNPLFVAHAGNLTVLNNYARPEWSWGHLARDWNTAALYGFQDPHDPISEVVVGVQGDISLVPKWAHAIYDEHTKNGALFIQGGRGDAFHSWTAEGVRKLGLWDERYCDIGFQEEDMFLRAVILEPSRVRINDIAHKRVHNPFFLNPVAGDGDHDREGHPKEHWHSQLYQMSKWPRWKEKGYKWWLNTTDMRDAMRQPAQSTFYLYPYFEWRLEQQKERLGYLYEVNPNTGTRA